MATFPAIIPDHPATKEVRIRETAQALGDGRNYTSRFGLNSFDTLWKLRWDYLTHAEFATIESFLIARADDGQPLEWTPPDAASPQQFKVEEWRFSIDNPAKIKAELVFRFVRDGEGGVIESITCAEDAEISDLPPDPDPDPSDPPVPSEYLFVRWNGVRATMLYGPLTPAPHISHWFPVDSGQVYSVTGASITGGVSPSNVLGEWVANVEVTQVSIIGGIMSVFSVYRNSPSPAEVGLGVFNTFGGAGPFPMVIAYAEGSWEFSNTVGTPKTVDATWEGVTYTP